MRSSSSNGSRWMSDARSSMASFNTWLTKRMIEASSAALSRSVSSRALSSTTWNGVSSSSVSMVSAPTPRCFLISRWMASVGERTGLRRKPVMVLSESSPWVAKRRLVAISMEPLIRRSGSNCSFSRTRAGKSESSCRSGSTESSGANGSSYSPASHFNTSSSDLGRLPGSDWHSRRRFSASRPESCRDSTMRSSMGFNPLALALVLVSVGAGMSGSLHAARAVPVRLLQQAHHHRRGFLADGQHLAEFLLRGGQIGLLRLLAFTILGELGLDLIARRLAFNRFLQRFGVGIGLAKHAATIAAAAGGAAVAAAATTAAAAAESAKAAAHAATGLARSEEHTSELQSQFHLVCRLLLEKKK